jgi:XisI protein
MEKITLYENAILEIINNQRPVLLQDPDCYVITDNKKHHYQILLEGWGVKEKHDLKIFMHFHIRPNGKIYILENHSSTDVGEALMDSGVPKSDIVLAFLPEYAREISGYALA